MISRVRRAAALWGLVIIMTGGGIMHFVAPKVYAEAIPPFLPFRFPLVYISGVVEAASGVLLAVPRTRRFGAWTVIAVLIVIFPANVYMAIEGPRKGAAFPFNSQVALWLRLPLQGLLIAWGYRFTKPTP